MSDEPIVVGVDGTPESRAAVRWAAREAALRECDLRILSAARDDAARTERADALVAEGRDLARATARGVRAGGRVVTADPADALVAAAGAATMLVIGRRAHGPVADLVLGSVIREVTAHAPGITVVVRAGESERTGGDVVVGVDGSAHAARALDAAVEEARLRGVRLVPVYAESGSIPWRSADLAPQYTPEVEVREARERLTHWLERHIPDRSGLDVRPRVLVGGAADVLTDASDGASLLVVGARGHTEASRILLGSVSRRVLHHATCPVAIVRPHRP